LGHVFVGEQTLGVSAPANVEAYAAIAVSRSTEASFVVDGEQVVLALGDVLEDRRHRMLLRIVRQPDPSSQSRPICEGDGRVVQAAERPRSLDDRHRR